ncbi:glycerophosphodiester phosphodiesterase family protein [Bradyrhizobium sp. F1.13.3]|uniref:glycerophosphodiester phosphodiesterase family protein n=1 Tax=Bradyrhizobium sp. F1.13.3 TaxID=3156351 RepID=UPI00339337AE
MATQSPKSTPPVTGRISSRRPRSKTRGIDPHPKQMLQHRGVFDNSKDILENTISAADNALQHGFHGVELDLRAHRSGHAWMMHDTLRSGGLPETRTIA